MRISAGLRAAASLVALVTLAGEARGADEDVADCGPVAPFAETYRRAVLGRNLAGLVDLFADRVLGCADDFMDKRHVAASILTGGTAVSRLLFDTAAIRRDESLNAYWQESLLDLLKRPGVRLTIEPGTGRAARTACFSFAGGPVTHEVCLVCVKTRWRIQSWPFACWVGM